MEKKYMEEYKMLGLNIAYYRRLKNYSQMKLADQLEISRTHMSRIENCDCAASLDLIFNIAKVLDIEVYKLFQFK